MASSLNKVTLIGNVGRDPEIRSSQEGREIASLSLATTESWKDKNTGEKRDRTEWHRVVIFSQHLISIIKNYVHKGSRLYIEGALQTRKWSDQSNVEKYTTEIVLQQYNSTLLLLDKFASDHTQDSGRPNDFKKRDNNVVPAESIAVEDIDDDIPF